jgi:hypothetical protein
MSVNPHQFPRAGECFLDHVAIFVREFEHSGAALQRLGFTLTPFRAHTSALRPGEPLTNLGTGNRCAMFRSGFLEVLGATADTPMAALLRQQLARYAGLHLIAFSGQNVDATHAALHADGLKPLPIAKIRRTQSTPDGEQEILSRIIRLSPEAWPEGRVQIVFPEMSPDAMWHAALVEHANGADRLSEVLIVVQDPAARVAQFARFTRRPVRAVRGRHVLETDRGRIHLIAAHEAGRYIPGLDVPAVPFIAAAAIGSRDLAATRALFDSRGISYTGQRATVQLAAHESLGATLIFHDRQDDKVFDSLDSPIKDR